MKIFFHVAAMNEAWKEVFHEIYSKLQNTELLDFVNNNIFIGFVGKQEDLEYLKDNVLPNTEIKDFGEDFKQYEFPTLLALEEYCHNNNDQVFYLHTKGISLEKHAGKKYWRRAMIKYLINDWKTCVEQLKNNDAVGYNWKDWNHGTEAHFSGNWWYSNPGLIRSSVSLQTLIDKPNILWEGLGFETNKRLQAEFWLKTGLNALTRIKSVGATDFDNEYRIHPNVPLDKFDKDPFDAVGLKVDRRYLINIMGDDRRKDNGLIQTRLSGIRDVLVYPAIDARKKGIHSIKYLDKPGVAGCHLTHEALLTNAYIEGYESVLIMEDDIKFDYGFQELLTDAWKDVPSDWEIIWFGSYEKQKHPTINIKNRVHIPHNHWGGHCYLVNKTGLAKIVPALKTNPINEEVDVYIHKHIKGLKQYSFYPTMVFQVGFKSTIR